ncbi:Sulfate adenylyltransferase subunit 1 [Bienertia sinuspersici]
MESVSLRFYHGGGFDKSKNGLLYVGGQIKTVEVDPNQLCGFWLKELAGDEVFGKVISQPSHTPSNVSPLPKVNRPKNLTPKRAPTGATRRCPRQVDSPAQKEPATGQSTLTLNDALNVDPINLNISTQSPSLNNDNDKDIRPDSPLGWSDLLTTDFSSDVDDSESDYEGDYEDESDDYEDEEQQTGEEIVGEEFVGDIDTSDEETRIARDRVKGHNKELDAGEQGPLSDYGGSDQDIHTPPEIDDEESLRQSREERSLMVSENSEWASFKWKAGQRFPTRELFKKAVVKFAIIQGRNLSIVVSNKKRNQRIGVTCIGDCPFRLYSSWDSRRASFVVKTVMDEHTCCRNMVKNKKLKSTWCAEQLLEVFKAKPHWPAKDIIETIRRAYKVVVKKDFAYKIKHYAHRMLHGSMKDHYKKVGRYLQALKDSSPGTHLELVLTIQNDLPPPVFQRLFVCFDGIKKEWKEGCRQVICVDACFLKTFLGGQLMSAVGRDGNDQMFPIAWAVVEGENYLSWEWFFTELQKALELGDGTSIAVISDEHQVSSFSSFNL